MPRWLGGTMVAAMALLGAGAAGTNPVIEPKGQAPLQDIARAYSRLPLSFEANHGQTDTRVKFLARGNGYNVLLRPAEAEIKLRRQREGKLTERVNGRAGLLTEPERASVTMRLVGADPSAKGRAERRQRGVSHYLRGRNDSSWIRNVPHFERVRFEDVYQGVDVVYYGNQRQLEHDFVVAPGADPNQVQLEFAGAKSVSVDGSGNLSVETPSGSLGLQKPLVYQEIEGARLHIDSAYTLADNGKVGFQIAEYDKSKPLVIDPVLLWGTYLGGSGLDQGNGLALDPEGFVYVSGSTDSVDFPTTAGAFQTNNAGLTDAYVCKINEEGTELVYSTYIGGTGQDYGNDVAVDMAGRPYVCGATNSQDFPIASPPGTEPAQPIYGGGAADAFVTRLTVDGSGIFYSTYVGNYAPPKVIPQEDIAYAIAVDPAGNAYITGSTTGGEFWTVSPIQGLYGGGPTDAFVTGLDVLGQISFSTFLGGGPENYGGNTDFGEGTDVGYGIDVDSQGFVYICGGTNSKYTFPVFNNLQRVNRSKRPDHSDGWVAKMVPSGQKFVWSTYLGGVNDDKALDVAADEVGNAYVTGYTKSNNFPISKKEPRPYRGTPYGKADAFVTKIDAAGFQLVYSTYLGGSGDDFGQAIAVGPNGIAYVTGYTSSVNFPTTRAMQKHFGGLFDAFVTKLDSTASNLIYSGYFGSNDQDYGNAIAVNGEGDVYIAGTTLGATFPGTSGTIQPGYGGGVSDAFLVKVTDEAPIVASGTIKVGKKLVFPKTPVGFVISKRIRIMNVAKTPLAVKIQPCPPPFTVADGGGSYIMPPRSYQWVTIQFKPDVIGPMNHTMIIECSDKKRSSVKVNLSGRGFIPL